MLQLSSAALDLKSLQFTTGAGSATVPSHSFGPDLSTGLYRLAASTIGLTCGGTKQLDLSATAAQFTAPVFALNQPYYSVLGNGSSLAISTSTKTTLTEAGSRACVFTT